MSDVLMRAANDIENSLWEKIVISVPLLYTLKDIVWFNLEHLPNGGESRGRTNLKYFGEKYPNFIYQNSIYVTPDSTEKLLKELEEIRRQWSNEWYHVSLEAKTDAWNGGPENPSNVIVYDAQTEKPSKYGYNPYNTFGSGIFDKHGNQMASSDIEVVLCKINGQLGSYQEEPLLRATLERLAESCRKAVRYNKGVFLDLESYSYE